MSYQEKWRARPPTLSHRGAPAADVAVGESLPQRGPFIHNAWRPFEDAAPPNILASFHVPSPGETPPVPIAAKPAPGLPEAELAQLVAETHEKQGQPGAALAPEQRAELRRRALAGEGTFKLADEFAVSPNAVVAIRDMPQYLLPD